MKKKNKQKKTAYVYGFKSSTAGTSYKSEKNNL